MWYLNKYDNIINLYHPDLILHLQGQTLQFITSLGFYMEKQQETCGWTVWGVIYICNVQPREIKWSWSKDI